MINALKLILDFFLKSQIIQRSIAISIFTFAFILASCLGIGGGKGLYDLIKQGKGLSDVVKEVKAIIHEVK